LGIAVVFMDMMSDPAFGSVMAKQLIVSVETILGRYFFFCSSEP
jgi:hypothetical protein